MKEKILEWLKFTVCVGMMAMGFLATYSLIWAWLCIPLGWWSGLTVAVLTIASVYGLIKWMED